MAVAFGSGWLLALALVLERTLVEFDAIPEVWPLLSSGVFGLALAVVVAGAAFRRQSSRCRRQTEVESRLRRREEELWQILDLIPSYVFAKDSDGRFFIVNKAVADAYGMTVEQIVGRTNADLPLAPDVIERLRGADEAVMVTGRPFVSEEQFTDVSGVTRIIRTSKIPFTRAGTQQPAILGFAVDVTELRHAEEALRVSDERYRRAIAEAGAVPYQRDYATDTFSFMGDEIERITGYSPDEITVSRWNSMIEELILRGEASGLNLNESRHLVREGQMRRWQADVRIRTRSGESRWLFDSSIQLMNESGVVVGSLGILQDVTERMQTEIALRESEGRFRALIENTADPLFVHDLEGRLVDVNQQACTSLGYSRGELLEIRMADFDRASGPDQYPLLWKAVSTHGPQTLTGEYLRSDGSTLPVEVRVGHLEIGGRPLLLALARDVTERARAERERELFSRLAVELTVADTPRKVAEAAYQVIKAFWNPDAFFLSVRVSGRARYRSALKVDTMPDGSKLAEEGTHFYEAGQNQETAPLFSGSPLLINRPEARISTQPFGSERPSVSLMYAPMRAGQRLQGIVSAQSYTPHQFAQTDLDLLQRVADAAAPALERCRAERRATSFLQLGEQLSQADTPEETARIIAQVADEAVGWDATLLYFYSQKEDRVYRLLCMDEVEGKRVEIEPNQSGQIPQGNMRHVIAQRKPLLILRQDLPSSGEFTGAGNTARPSSSIIWVPIRSISGMIGLLSIQSYTRNAYDDEDVETMQALAAQAAGALERTLAQKSLREREARYRQAIAGAGAVPYQLDYARGEYVFVGEGIEQITGYAPEEFSAARMKEMVVEVVLRGDGTGLSARDASAQVRQAGTTEWRADICIRSRSGEIRWLSDTSVQVFDEYGAACGSLGILEDITERKRAEESLRQSEERYRRTITEAGAVPYQRDYSKTETFTFIGEGIERITGYTPQEITFRIWEEMIEEVIMLGEADGLDMDEAVIRTRGGAIREWRADVRIRTRDGQSRWLSDTSIQLQTEGGSPYGALGILIDITERKQAEQALRESEERYALATQAANDGLWDWDLQTNTVYYAPRWVEMLGLSAHETTNSPEEWFSRVHPDDVGRLREEIARNVAGHGSAHFQVEYRMRHRDSGYRHMLCRGLAVRNGQGAAYRMAGSQSDVTERYLFEQQLVHDALHDTLTSLPNRALLMERLTHALERARRRGEYGFALIFLDLDRFKVINDSLGHLAGDLLLKAVARRLENCVRPGDTVARFAGDEFTVLLEDLGNSDDARIVAERMLREIAQPLNLEGQVVYTTASMGIALGTPAYTAPEDLLRDADNALYRAKAAGKAGYEIFDPSMHATAVEALALETELRRAINANELTLYYQPIVSLETGTIVGFEALARWLHPQRGLISPGSFIPLAEETGLIVPLGEWLVLEAAQCLRRWQEEFGCESSLTMSINLSGRQFSRQDLAQSLEQAVHRAGVTPPGIALEITESVLMQNPEAVAPQLERLRAAGFSIHLDDFGTGYSSFSYLHRFPITSLKVDRSFVSSMGEGAKEVGITRSIIQLASSLGLSVTAEGVETHDQLNLLREMGCSCIQGYLIARPAPADQCTELLRRKLNW